MPPLDALYQHCAHYCEIFARILFSQGARQHSGREECIGNHVMFAAQHRRRHSIKHLFPILGKSAQGCRFQRLRRDVVAFKIREELSKCIHIYLGALVRGKVRKYRRQGADGLPDRAFRAVRRGSKQHRRPMEQPMLVRGPPS